MNESNFWKELKRKVPEGAIAFRLENKGTVMGIPDVHMLWNKKSFWFELKVTKTYRVKISEYQISFNTKLFLNGANNYYLVKHLKEKSLFLFEGNQGLELREKGLKAQGKRFENFEDLFLDLRPNLRP